MVSESKSTPIKIKNQRVGAGANSIARHHGGANKNVFIFTSHVCDSKQAFRGKIDIAVGCHINAINILATKELK
jgi:hypothetical protein